MEIWKDIKGYEGMYQVSSLGRVKAMYRNCPIEKALHKLHVGYEGYLFVILSNNGSTVTLNVHELVATTFLDYKQISNKFLVCHKNMNKWDNSVDNLEVILKPKNPDLLEMKILIRLKIKEIIEDEYSGKTHRSIVGRMTLEKIDRFIDELKN